MTNNQGVQPKAASVEDLALHPDTKLLVERFALALAEKLAKAEAKYGYTDGWLSANWEADCREALLDHVQKGDPRDVAAYCAFMWHHGWSTSVVQTHPQSPVEIAQKSGVRRAATSLGRRPVAGGGQ